MAHLLKSPFHQLPDFGAQTPGRPVEMDGSRFAKLCRECGVQGGKLNSIAIDIIFSKVKAKVRDRDRLGRVCVCCGSCMTIPKLQ